MAVETGARRSLTRRSLLAGGTFLAGLVAGRMVLRPLNDPGPAYSVPKGGDNTGEIPLNDASELSLTPVRKHLTVTKAPDEATVDGLRMILSDAKASGQPVVASAARHSMGGQSLVRHGTVLTLEQEWLEADAKAGVYRVAAGTRWSTVISRLDAIGFSPKVMQSNNNFSVASTYSVNAHGWPVPFSACGSTVRSLKMLTASGELLTCSRTENAMLFGHAMGGYGLFGIITELEMEMVPNTLLDPTFDVLPGNELGLKFVEALATDKSIQMAYGRLDVSLDRFFDEGLLVTYRPVANPAALPPLEGSGFISHRSRDIFRAQLEFDQVKHVRWWTESRFNPMISGSASRNSLMNEPVITLDDRDPSRTDILHEYFVSPARFADFVNVCKEVIPASYQQLLNITLRFVDTDRESTLAYATEPRIAAVMLFSQEKTMRGEADMARMTEALIDRVLELGGTYYLPYRPHARLDQLKSGYRAVEAFVEAKRTFDPELRFRNGLWDNYLSKI